MRHPLLPQLIADNQVTHFTRAGDWEKRQAGELRAISEGLDVTDTTISDEVDSIPNIWARPLLFEMALYDTRHPMHLRVLGEWRGLLAMLALKEWCEFPLTTDQIDITDMTNPQGAEDFLQALQRLRPKSNPDDILDETTTWNTLNIIEFNDKPIGITSPTTLVCTSVNCFARISGVPWFNGKFLENPVPNLNNFEKRAVAGWLNNLHGSTNTLPNTNIKHNLRGLLYTFIENLGNDIAGTTLSAGGLGLTQNLFTAMNNPVAPQELPSSIKLVPSENKEPQKTLLVFDKSIAEEWGVAPQDVCVWKGKTLATTQDFSGKRKPKLSLPNDVELRRPQDFFSDKLFVISGKNAFLKDTTLVAKGSADLKFNQIDVTPILPFTQELLTYFDVRDLSERITFEQPHHGAPITVSLDLNLSGTTEQPDKKFTIKKVYKEADIKTISTAPTVAIWPNFRTPDWKAYYTYFTTDGQETFYTKPFLAAGEKSDPRPDKDDRGNVKGEIIKTERFPEAMLCEYEGAKVGVLLISVPEEIKGNNETWCVGVDFGTSSTTVYNRKGDAAPQPVSFNDRILYISKSDAYQPSMVYNDFLSPKREETPFFSLFQESENKKNNEPLLDGHIYFLEDYNKLSSAKNLVSNLKWSAIPKHREHVREFLKQLCLQCAAEAINDGATGVKCNFSYPLSFTLTNRDDFTDIWRMVASDCEKKTGVSHQIVTPGQSESVVAAKFFASTLQNTRATGGFTSAAVCIDIGGETSDISIWQDNRLYWETSLRFAGRRIFLDMFKENPDFLNIFPMWDPEKDLEENERIRKEAITSLKSMKNNDDQFYAQADALIQDKGQVLLNQLSLVGDKSAIQPFFQLISLGVAGLLYYVGLLLNHLSNNTNFNSDIPSIYIGGNGSKILNWMARGSFNPDEEKGKRCRQHLKHVILMASEFADNNRGIEISESPKAEAAYGLVAESTKLTSDGIELTSNETDSEFLVGEKFTENGTDYEWDEILTSERLGNRIRVSKNNLEKIDNFIESFNAPLDVEMSFDLDETLSGETQDSATIREVIFEGLEKVFQDYSDDPQEISGEPIFILALKELLKAKTRQWKNVLSKENSWESESG